MSSMNSYEAGRAICEGLIELAKAIKTNAPCRHDWDDDELVGSKICQKCKKCNLIQVIK